MGAPSFVTVLTGPTASGKTAVSLALAELLGAEIINADSRQVYRGFDIGTAKPSADELERIPHHGIDVCGADETWTAGRFFKEAQQWIHDIAARGKRVLVVGGSGLYVRALVRGIFDGPEISDDIRNELRRRLRRDGLDGLNRELARLDPETAGSIDTRNPVRVLRALEVCVQSGRPYSILRNELMPHIPYKSLLLGIDRERSELYRLIDRRVDGMIAAGFEKEVRFLLESGIDPACPAMQSVGYKEMAVYFSGSSRFDETVELIKQHTRNFAKRQMTWFRREAGMHWQPAEAGTEQVVTRFAELVFASERG